MQIYLDDTIDSYRTFLRIKSLPRYEIHGRMAVVPDEYAATLGVVAAAESEVEYTPSPWLFDYQRDIVSTAIRKRKFAIFADCGLGKTPMLLEFARHVLAAQAKPVLIVSPLMVVPQTIAECQKFYGDTLPIEQVAAKDLAKWMKKPGSRLGITNYDALRDDTPQGNLGGLILDESSMLKSHYGKWGQVCLRLGAGLHWKLAATGTPAPNDRIEYANHAVFLDAFPNVNSFLARFFVNRGQTNERWELKPHALRPFYRALSHWSIFLTDPSTYGWKDNVHNIPPIHVHIEDVKLSAEQEQAVRQETGQLFVTELGGITTRSKLSRMAKCGSSPKPQFIADMVRSFGTENTIVWCRYNDEQRAIEQAIPNARSIDGDTPYERRLQVIDWFKGNLCLCGGATCCDALTLDTCGPTTKRTEKSTGSQKKRKKSETGGEESGTQQTQSFGKSASCFREDDAALQSANTLLAATTESGLMSTASCLSNSSIRVQSAESRIVKNGSCDCTLTTVTGRVSCEDSCAPLATTALESSATQNNCSIRPSCTCGHKTGGRVLISKARVIGFGLNLQVCTRQVFSGLQDSYEEYYQAVKRSNRIGSTKPLNVHIPVSDVERPMVENVLRKARRVEADTREQEALFRDSST